MGMSLKYYRIIKGLSQSQLSAASEVPIRVIQKIEQGVTDVKKTSSGNILKISEALDISVEELLKEEHDEV
jgi:transcriptional regulator with XRE-family HTH domain